MPRLWIAHALRGEAVFDRVTFAYDEGKTVLTEVSFRSEPDTVTALVGPSGGRLRGALRRQKAGAHTHIAESRAGSGACQEGTRSAWREAGEYWYRSQKLSL